MQLSGGCLVLLLPQLRQLKLSDSQVEALLLRLLLTCQSSTSASHVGTVLLSVVGFRAVSVSVSVESVLVGAANTHLTLTNML